MGTHTDSRASTRPTSPYAPHPANRVEVRPGQRVRLEVPHSEVCMHMRVAGTVMDVEVLGRTFGDVTYVSAQLYRLDGRPFSAPIGLGEAGIYGTLADGMYAYGEVRS
jgi:hypothetical protein